LPFGVSVELFLFFFPNPPFLKNLNNFGTAFFSNSLFCPPLSLSPLLPSRVPRPCIPTQQAAYSIHRLPFPFLPLEPLKSLTSFPPNPFTFPSVICKFSSFPFPPHEPKAEVPHTPFLTFILCRLLNLLFWKPRTPTPFFRLKSARLSTSTPPLFLPETFSMLQRIHAPVDYSFLIILFLISFDFSPALIPPVSLLPFPPPRRLGLAIFGPG